MVLLKNSVFWNDTKEGSNGDGIDLSGSDRVTIEGAQIANMGDKGVSIGEACSNIEIKKTTIWKTNLGIASKDHSSARISDSVIYGTSIGLDLYRKKQEYLKAGDIVAERVTLGGNKQEFRIADGGVLTISQSHLQTAYPGDGNDLQVPSEEFLLPPLLRAIKK